AFLVDTTAPTAPAVALTSDTGTAGDGVTSNGSITVSGLESGASWQYSSDGGTTWNTGTGSTFTLVDGSYTVGSVKVRQTDAAGNVSTDGANTLAYTIDSGAPSVIGVAITGA